MGQVGGDGFVVAGLVQIGDGSLRKKEGSVGLWRKKEEMERQWGERDGERIIKERTKKKKKCEHRIKNYISF